MRIVRKEAEIYCKTLKFREHLIFPQIREGGGQGGQGLYSNL